MIHRFWHVTACTATILAAVLSSQTTPAFAQDEDLAPDDGASVVMYHRFGENDYPSTNTRLEQLDAHIQELKNGEYTLLSLGEIVRRVKAGEDFPEKSVGVTIDDAYRSVYTEAWPRFKEAGIPFTLFVATNPVDRGLSRYMTWNQIREIANDPLVTIGSQTATHLHMIDVSEAQNRQDLDASNKRFQNELGYVPELIAYPYGEFSEDVIALSQELGFVAGFGQHSGAFGANDNIFALPRFAMNENYGDVARLRTAAQSLPVPANDMTPTDTVVDPSNNPPPLGFTVPMDFKRMDQLACFSNHEGKLQLERLGPRVEVRMTAPLPKGRTRINCTMPAGKGRWRWFGKLLYVK
ncbi:polysaccharide deacetylase family protein [Magnetovibrio sp. PR-2]|uniref:polysaccharide deacetylase family protein n=1 Tax=Magnetovibrio sp. PR-2 TaxID=3120356 RepID=UPI002FCE3E1B